MRPSTCTSALEKSSSLGSSWLYVSRLGLHALGDPLGPQSQDLIGEDVELRRLVDRLDRVAAEKLVAPGDQVVEVLHHDGHLIRTGPPAERCCVG